MCPTAFKPSFFWESIPGLLELVEYRDRRWKGNVAEMQEDGWLRKKSKQLTREPKTRHRHSLYNTTVQLHNAMGIIKSGKYKLASLTPEAATRMGSDAVRPAPEEMNVTAGETL